MPVEKTENEIKISIKSSKKYLRLRKKDFGKGITAVIGFKKGGGSEVQSYRFDIKKWTVQKAKAWVEEHKD